MLFTRSQFALIARSCGTGYVAILSVLASLTVLVSGSSVLAQDAHVHGVAELNIVREGQVVQIEFFSPGANLLGFERMPGAAEEWMRFASVVEDWKPAPGCWGIKWQIAICASRPWKCPRLPQGGRA
jgi:hypothetical protein